MPKSIYIKVKGIAAFAWIDRPSPKYGNFELTLRDVANYDEIAKQVDELIEEQLPKAKIKSCRKTPIGVLKPKDEDDDEVPVIKSRSQFPPEVYNAKGAKLKHSPSVGPGSKLIAEIKFEVKDGEKGPGVMAYLQSVQIVKLVEGKRGGSFEDVSDDEDAYTGEGAAEAAYDPDAKSERDEDDGDEGEEADEKSDKKKSDEKPKAKRKATDF